MNTKYRQILSSKLGVPENKINDDTVKYYYTKWPELCCKYNLEPLSTNVGPFEFNKAIKILNEYYKDVKSDYYSNLYSEVQKYKDGESLLDKDTNETLDHIV